MSETTWMARPPRDVVVASGPSALSFLQSLVSQDLDRLADRQSAHSLLLTPQGKLDVDFRIALVGDEAWLVCEGGFGERLAASLDRFKIRVQVALAERPDFAALAVRGPEPAARTRPGDETVVVPVPWPGGDRFDVVGLAAAVDEVEAALAESGVARIDDDAYEALRIEAGVPRQGLDTDEKTIPQEAFLERDAVSFDKGCFLGQEAVAKMRNLGHPRRWVAVLEAGGSVPLGERLFAGDDETGIVTSVASSNGTTLALARIRWEHRDAVLRTTGDVELHPRRAS
jgi:tRNA-modifying protein YgfZ